MDTLNLQLIQNHKGPNNGYRCLIAAILLQAINDSVEDASHGGRPTTQIKLETMNSRKFLMGHIWRDSLSHYCDLLEISPNSLMENLLKDPTILISKTQKEIRIDASKWGLTPIKFKGYD